MTDTGTPPVIPASLQQYNSYVVDPRWQRRFSIIWPSALAFFVLLALPHLIRSIRNRRAYSSLLGIKENLSVQEYDRADGADNADETRRVRKMGPLRKIENWLGVFGGVLWWMVPGIGLNAGQILLIAGYMASVVACIVIDAPLVSNSNRAGFLALAQFPIVFLFATKNSVVSLLLGPGSGYEKLNYIHRWSGRIMFLGSALHGALWIRNHLQYDLPIIGQQKEGSGVAALGLLGVVVLSSLPFVRRWAYQIFYVIHMLGFISFFVAVCYHTIYASPWIFPPLAFYGFDIVLRMFRHRIKEALLVPVGNQMTLIHVPYATAGWIAGQHVRLRVFFSGRVFESHPLTIISAPPDISCITSYPSGMSFGARAVGDWTKALNVHATQRAAETDLLDLQQREGKETDKPAMEVPAQVMIDGPYGGCSVDLGEYETALLFAGGSGITFALGVLDDIVGRIVRKGRSGGERTRAIELVWCVRSFGSIDWFAPALMDIARAAEASSAGLLPITLHISIYVTCLCNPEAVPPIPNCDVAIVRPSVYRVLLNLTSPALVPALTADSGDKGDRVSLAERSVDSETSMGVDPELDAVGRLPFVARAGGGLAVCASGPEGLIREVANGVARLQLSGRGVNLGGVGLHTEIFAL